MTRYMQCAQHVVAGLYAYVTMILLDVSASMRASDWPPSRLHGAVDAIRQMLALKIREYPDDHVGIVTFSNVAAVHLPLSRVADGAIMPILAADQIKTGPATNITEALELAETALLKDGGFTKNHLAVPSVAGPPVAQLRQIVLLTDGQHNEGPKPVPKAQQLKDAGVLIEVIGIGTPSSLDATCLRDIASVDVDGNAAYCFIGDKQELANKMRELAHHHLRPL